MEGWERVQYIMEIEGFNKNSFSAAIGINNNVTITRIINERRNPSHSTCEKIISRFPKYNLEWLEFGIGDMINKNQNTAGRDNYGSQGSGDNKSSYSNVGNTKISVTMPESGTQKIIKPTGEVEIHRTEPSEHSEEINKLKQRIQDLERIIAEKDVTIQSKEATIQSKDDTIKTKDELISFLKGDRR